MSMTTYDYIEKKALHFINAKKETILIIVPEWLRDEKNLKYGEKVVYKKETEKSILIAIENSDGYEVWLPKSQISFESCK